MIVDVHRHYMPKELYESYGPLSKPTWRYNDPVLEFTFYNKLYQVDVQLKDMDEAGIDIAVLSLAQFNLKGLETCQSPEQRHRPRGQGASRPIHRGYPGAYSPRRGRP